MSVTAGDVGGTNADMVPRAEYERVVADLNKAKASHAEFRENNRRLMTSLGIDPASPAAIDAALARADALKGLDPEKIAALRTIDPAEYERLKAHAAKLERKGVKDPDKDFDALIQAAIAPMSREVEALKREREEQAKRLSDATLRETIHTVATKAGARSDMLDFLLYKANGTFVVQDGAVKAAPTQFSTERPGQPLSVEEWLSAQMREHPGAFNPSQGGGAAPSRGRSVAADLTSFRTPGGGEVKLDGIKVL